MIAATEELMMRFSDPPLSRDQLVLFAERLDQAIPADHSVRLVDEILGRLSWSEWEQQYNGQIGRPPIHPRVIASVILYGILCGVRTSRSLEEALTVRNDFRWLVEGRTIDQVCEILDKKPGAIYASRSRVMRRLQEKVRWEK